MGMSRFVVLNRLGKVFEKRKDYSLPPEYSKEFLEWYATNRELIKSTAQMMDYPMDEMLYAVEFDKEEDALIFRMMFC